MCVHVPDTYRYVCKCVTVYVCVYVCVCVCVVVIYGGGGCGGGCVWIHGCVEVHVPACVDSVAYNYDSNLWYEWGTVVCFLATGPCRDHNIMLMHAHEYQ